MGVLGLPSFDVTPSDIQKSEVVTPNEETVEEVVTESVLNIRSEEEFESAT